MKHSNFWHSATRNVADTPGGPPSPTPESTPTPDPAAAPVAAPDLSFIPQDFHRDGAPDLAGFTTHYQELVARDAQRAEREAGIPEAYQFSLPEGFTFDGIEGLPADYAANFTPDDPTLKPLYDELGAVLKEEGASGATSQKLMGILAKYEAVQYAQAVKEIEADLGKLGTRTQVEARVGVIGRALETRLPADEATALKGLLRTSSAIKAVERLLGPARPSVVPAGPLPNSNADLEGMTPFERLKVINAKS